MAIHAIVPLIREPRAPVPAGTTLVEAIAGLTLALIVMAVAARSLDVARRLLERSDRRGAARLAARAAAAVLAAEVEGLPGSEVVVLDSTRVRFSARRGGGVLCRQVTGSALTVRQAAWWASREPDPGRDSLLVRLVAPAGWYRTAVTSAGTSTCADGSSALRLSTSVLPDSIADRVSEAAPVVLVETAEYRLYRDATGAWLLGERHRSGGGWTTTSPVAGPLAANGIRMELVSGAGGRSSALAVTARAATRFSTESTRVVVALEP
ncbi:MAG TPA: hypothetical protein VNL98_13635 [Gemmatimonadales bacterium]|nr:hypothetical protein [Gemmatimonadales bacterium]